MHAKVHEGEPSPSESDIATLLAGIDSEHNTTTSKKSNCTYRAQPPDAGLLQLLLEGSFWSRLM